MPDADRPVEVRLTLRHAGPDAAPGAWVGLRRLLKALLRRGGWRCTGIERVRPGEARQGEGGPACPPPH